jgi:SAM-dependent methyltransferase
MRRLFVARDYRRPSDPMERSVFWCSTCTYGCVEGNFTPKEVARFYEIPYYTHHEICESGNQEASKRVPFLDRLLAHLAWRVDFGRDVHPSEIEPVSNHGSRTLCDIGCGSGDLLAKFKAAGYHVLGIEPDPKARAVAQRIGEVLDGTAEQLPSEVKGRSFDVVLLSHVLEHFIEPLSALRNARKILASGGTLIIEVPNNAALGFSKFQAAWPWTDMPRHLHFFSERSLRAALYAAGLLITKTNYLGYTRQFQPDWFSNQYEIWAQIEKRPAPNFRRAAWLLLLRTAIARRQIKYDSVRVHAQVLQAGSSK